MKCIQKSADKRYENAAELVADLDALMIDPVGDYGLLYHTTKRQAPKRTSVSRILIKENCQIGRH
jgi:hypothetical protein